MVTEIVILMEKPLVALNFSVCFAPGLSVKLRSSPFEVLRSNFQVMPSAGLSAPMVIVVQSSSRIGLKTFGASVGTGSVGVSVGVGVASVGVVVGGVVAGGVAVVPAHFFVGLSTVVYSGGRLPFLPSLV